MLILKKVVEVYGWEALISWRARTLRDKIYAYRGIKSKLLFLDTEKTLSLILKHHGKSTGNFNISDESEAISLKSRLSEIEQDIKILRRNRMMVKQIGKQFADYIQVEFNIPCDALLMAFPEWYKPSRYNPLRFSTYKVQTFQAVTVVDSKYVPVTETIEHELQPIPFGDLQGWRMYAGYHPETYTVYIGEKWHKDEPQTP